jgi:hypothetical protein
LLDPSPSFIRGYEPNGDDDTTRTLSASPLGTSSSRCVASDSRSPSPHPSPGVGLCLLQEQWRRTRTT